MFHRQDMHKMLKDTALQQEGEGTPARLVVNHEVNILLLHMLDVRI
jgi:salicylate hydroxylase